MYRKSCMVAAAILLLASSQPASGGLSDCIDATCRITAPDGGRGTGCVFERSQGAVYVLTAAHVASDRAVKCEFWQQGHQSAPLVGETILRVLNDTTDAAVIAVPESEFGGRFPAAIPLAPRSYAIQAGQTLSSVGCAGGAWATGWKGHVLGYDGTDVRFVPTPANGRSGSALFDANGERIVGIIRARTLDNGQGIATGTQALYGQLCRAVAERQTQCGPNGCPGGQCPTPGKNGGSGNQYRLLPYRQQQQQQQQQLNPWPTMPAPLPSPAAPVDLGPTNDRLDRIAGMLSQAPVPPPQQQMPPPAQPDPVALQAAADIARLATAVPMLIDEKIKPVVDGLRETRELLGPIIKIKDKLEADAEAGGIKGKLAQRILDRFDPEAAAGADPTQWVKHVIYGVIAVALVAFGVLHLIRTGRGPVGERIQNLAEKHPDNARLQALNDKIGSIEGRLADRLDDLPLLRQLARGGAGALGGALAGAPLGPPGMAAGAAAAIAPEAIHQLLAKLDALHNKMDNNTAVSTQAAQAAAVAANK